jgi:hypothetical protein
MFVRAGELIEQPPSTPCQPALYLQMPFLLHDQLLLLPAPPPPLALQTKQDVLPFCLVDEQLGCFKLPGTKQLAGKLVKVG